MKPALILSGGGARGAYQVGVLKAVSEVNETQKGVLVASNRLRWDDVAFPIPNATVEWAQFPAITTIRIMETPQPGAHHDG